MMLNPIISQTAHNLKAMIDLDSYPAAPALLANGEGRSRPAERIAHQIAWLRRNLDDSIEHFGRQGVSSALFAFEFPVAHRRDIGPYVFEIDAKRVHRAAVTTIILDLTAAVPARFNWRPHPPESPRLPFRKIQKAIMRRVKPPWYRQATFHFDGYGVPELHSALHQISSDQNVPTRQVVDEERAARLQDADALVQPEFAPVEVFTVASRIVRPTPIKLPKIKGRVGENGVRNPRRKTRQDIEAVALEQHALRSGMIWRGKGSGGGDRTDGAA